MKCPECGQTTSVAETRVGQHETMRRRRRCSCGHAFTTIEMPAECCERADRQLLPGLTRFARSVRNALIKNDPRPVAEIAESCGLKASIVYQIKGRKKS